MPRFSLQPQAVRFVQPRRSQTVGFDRAAFGTAAQAVIGGQCTLIGRRATQTLMQREKPRLLRVKAYYLPPTSPRRVALHQILPTAIYLPGLLNHGMQPSDQTRDASTFCQPRLGMRRHGCLPAVRTVGTMEFRVAGSSQSCIGAHQRAHHARQRGRGECDAAVVVTSLLLPTPYHAAPTGYARVCALRGQRPNPQLRASILWSAIALTVQ